MSQLGNNDKMNEGASDAPQLCRNCCEFFGQKHNDFLCSKCFKQIFKLNHRILNNPRERSKTEEKVNNLLNNTLPAPQETVQVQKIVEEEKPKTEMIIEPVQPAQVEEEKAKPVREIA